MRWSGLRDFKTVNTTQSPLLQHLHVHSLRGLSSDSLTRIQICASETTNSNFEPQQQQVAVGLINNRVFYELILDSTLSHVSVPQFCLDRALKQP